MFPYTRERKNRVVAEAARSMVKKSIVRVGGEAECSSVGLEVDAWVEVARSFRKSADGDDEGGVVTWTWWME